MHLRDEIYALEAQGVDLVAILGADQHLTPEELGKVLSGLPSGAHDSLYSELLYFVARLELPEDESKALWEQILRHKQRLKQQLNRNVGFQVAMLDYLSNKRQMLDKVRFLNSRVYQTLITQVDHDSLTGVFNRRFFQQHLLREIKRAHRYGSALSLLMLDLDNFKLYNDTCGHLAGDRALAVIADSLKKTVRAADLVCRYGGDEFAVICSRTVKHDALTLADRLCARVKALNLLPDVKSYSKPLGVSVGLATCPEDASEVEALIQIADDALFAAKKEGDHLDALKRGE